MKKFIGTVKTNSGQRDLSVMANDANHASKLLEQHGRVLYIPRMVAS